MLTPRLLDAAGSIFVLSGSRAVNAIRPPLVQVCDENHVISQAAQPSERWHSNDERKQVVDERIHGAGSARQGQLRTRNHAACNTRTDTQACSTASD